MNEMMVFLEGNLQSSQDFKKQIGASHKQFMNISIFTFTAVT